MTRERKWRYRKVFPKLWRHPKFMPLEAGDKLLCVYMLSGPQTNRVGYYTFSPGQAAEDLGLNYETMPERIDRIVAAFEWRYDSNLRVVYVPSWFEWNWPDGPKVMIGAVKDASEVPKGALYPVFYASVASVCKVMGMAVPDIMTRPFDVDPMGYPSLYPTPYPIGDTMPSGMASQGTGNREVQDEIAPAQQTRGRRSSGPDPRAKPFLEWYASEYERVYGSPYVVTWARDMKMVKDLFRSWKGRVTDESRYARELAWTWLHMESAQFDRAARTVQKFIYNQNDVVERLSRIVATHGPLTNAMLGLSEAA